MINQTHKVGFVEVHSIVDSTDGKAETQLKKLFRFDSSFLVNRLSLLLRYIDEGIESI